MTLIPTDAGIRMRLQTEAPPAPVAPPTEAQVDLTDLPPGRIFSARIQDVLPENTYKALVAGRQITLSLPQGAEIGDTLELVVIDRSPRVVVAQRAPGQGVEAGGGKPYPFTNLSSTAQLIGGLLPREGESPAAVQLNRGQPLLASPGADAKKMASELAPLLSRAVSESGVFYESHQVQWALGQRPLQDLLAEPQGAHSSQETLAAFRPDKSAADAALIKGAGGTPAEVQTSKGPLAMLQSFLGLDEGTKPPETPTNTGAASTGYAPPEDIRPVVQQQLDAAATQRLSWHGHVWPQQTMQLQIEPDDKSSRKQDTEGARDWTSSLRLTTPRLGEIDASIKLGGRGVRIAISTALDASAIDMRTAAPALQEALAAAGIPLLELRVTKARETAIAAPPPNGPGE